MGEFAGRTWPEAPGRHQVDSVMVGNRLGWRTVDTQAGNRPSSGTYTERSAARAYADKLNAAEAASQTGARGGHYHVSASGRKIYDHKVRGPGPWK